MIQWWNTIVLVNAINSAPAETKVESWNGLSDTAVFLPADHIHSSLGSMWVFRERTGEGRRGRRRKKLFRLSNTCGLPGQSHDRERPAPGQNPEPDWWERPVTNQLHECNTWAEGSEEAHRWGLTTYRLRVLNTKEEL